jgi:hypothetical protein
VYNNDPFYTVMQSLVMLNVAMLNVVAPLSKSELKKPLVYVSVAIFLQYNIRYT